MALQQPQRQGGRWPNTLTAAGLEEQVVFSGMSRLSVYGVSTRSKDVGRCSEECWKDAAVLQTLICGFTMVHTVQT